MKVSENVEKGGAVLKMVSSSTGLLKGVVELSLAAAATCPAAAAAAGDNVVGSTAVTAPDIDGVDTTSSSRCVNGPSFTRSSSFIGGGGDKAAPGRLGKSLAWLRGRRRGDGTTPPSGGQGGNHRCGRRQNPDNQSVATHQRSNAVPPSVSSVDRTTAADTNRTRTSPFRDSNRNNNDDDGRQDPAAAVQRVYEKRKKWLKRCRRVAEPSPDGPADDVNNENGAAVSLGGFSGHRHDDAPPSAENRSVAISVISDGQSDAADAVGADLVVAGLTDQDGRPHELGVGVQAEVVLDPSALATAKTSVDNHNQTSVAVVNHVPPSTDAQPPALPPRQPNVDLRVEDNDHVVTPKRPSSIVLDPPASTADTEVLGLAPMPSDVDLLCNEIGRLVADYMRQQLASIVLAICLTITLLYTYYTLNHRIPVSAIAVSGSRVLWCNF